MNGMGDLSWYLGCAFERDKVQGFVKMTPTAFVDSLVECFDIQYASQTLVSIEFDLGPKGPGEKEGDWP